MARRLFQLSASVGGILLITWIAFEVIRVNATTVGFAYLLFILVVASAWGFVDALVASILATVGFNFFFLEPTLTFTIADPQNWVALFAFLATALLASRLSTAAKRRTMDAIERQQDLERLYTFGRAILLIGDNEPFPKQLIHRLAEAFDLSAAVLYDRRSGDIYRAGPREFEGMDSQLHEAALQGTTFTDPERRRIVTAVRLGSEPIASLALQGARMSDSVLQSVANLVAVGLERAKAQDLAHEVEVARRSERLRTTLLDAMAHEFKTPLTAIRAATTALLATPDSRPSSANRMLKIADEEAAHLEELIDNALDMAQVDNHRIDVAPEVSSLEEIVRQVVDSMKTHIGDRRVDVNCDANLPAASLDRRLMKLALKQILDNALKYSPPAQPVSVSICARNGAIALEVTDHGPGIPEREQVQIFDRFYRSAVVREQLPGSGLGLSIAQRIVQAHGGDITVRSHPGETTFCVELPVGGEES